MVSKMGLIYMTKWMAKTLGPKIRVNLFLLEELKENNPKDLLNNTKEVNQLYASEDDVLNSVIFLASGMSNYINRTKYCS